MANLEINDPGKERQITKGMISAGRPTAKLKIIDWYIKPVTRVTKNKKVTAIIMTPSTRVRMGFNKFS